MAKTRELFRRVLAAGSDAEIEELLLAADVGVEVSRLLARHAAGAGKDRRAVLEREIEAMLTPNTEPVVAGGRPMVVMVVGVNGSGKTTTVGKLCHQLQQAGRSVLLAAADTYRDAASEQLDVWASRAGVEIVRSTRGQDAGSVAYDAISKAVSRQVDVVLVDTAGRLHTRQDLMAEVVKIKHVCGRALAGAPHEVLLVLDATVGQNGLRQAEVFADKLGITGLVVAKLDGTAKGGVLLPIVRKLGLPVRYVGTGEGIDNLERFSPAEFAHALFED